jgi:hypothetical protein
LKGKGLQGLAECEFVAVDEIVQSDSGVRHASELLSKGRALPDL